MAAKIIGPDIPDPNSRFMVSYVDNMDHTWKTKTMLLNELQEWAEKDLPKLVEQGSNHFLIQESSMAMRSSNK